MSSIDRQRAMPLTDRFADALSYAAQTHRGQIRKGTTIPYVSHLLAVTALVLEDDGDEDQAIAAVLHDAVEDQGGREQALEIRQRFGDRVADIVEACSDTDQTPKPPWRQRKEVYLKRLETASEEVVRVSLADKLHNARSILRDYRKHGDGLWERFNGDVESQRWYYTSLLAVYRRRSTSHMVDELGRVLDELWTLVGEAPG